MQRHLLAPCLWICAALVALGSVGVFIPKAEANRKVRRATRYYLKGMKNYQRRRYRRAIRYFNRAARMLPRHPHFNCHKTRFLTYVGRSWEKLRSPRRAMRAYRKAKRAGCRSWRKRKYAVRRYRYLYRRWVCSIRIYSKPRRARVYMVTRKRDKYIGKTPLKRVLRPGRYKFKVRLFDHKSYIFKVRLRPGRHLRRRIKLVKGDDPIRKIEKPGIAPPPTMTALTKKKKPKKKKKKKKKKEDPIVILDDK